MNREEIIEKTIAYVKAELANAEGGHDWWHIYRVWHTAKEILAEEECDGLTVELAALLHDIADSKFNGGDESIGPIKAEQFLDSIHVDTNTTAHVVNIIKNISFKGGNFDQDFSSKELMVVQDADRLDAIGAIGIGIAAVVQRARTRITAECLLKAGAIGLHRHIRRMQPVIDHRSRQQRKT